MPRFHVTIERKRAEYLTVRVTAENEEEARNLALKRDGEGRYDLRDWDAGDVIEDSSVVTHVELPNYEELAVELGFVLVQSADKHGDEEHLWESPNGVDLYRTAREAVESASA
jgi:hypothetical protein